jgi:16S rRNA (cytidine1402-2'-O)-methyltransferase
MEKGVIYIVPTPIGNLSDMTFRAIEVLKAVNVIYAEDTRVSKILLNHYSVKTPLKSYHKFNEKARCEEIILLLNKGESVAIISDAGTPGISDPSNIIIQEVIKHDVKVCPLPGATAVIPALVASGFNTDNFCMIGFLPKKKADKEKVLEKLRKLEMPIVFYESPHRLLRFLEEIREYFPSADVSIAREISKIYESFIRGKLDDVIRNSEDIPLKGEFVIVVLPSNEKPLDVPNEVMKLKEVYYNTLTISEATRHIARDLSISRNEVYRALLNEQVLRE